MRYLILLPFLLTLFTLTACLSFQNSKNSKTTSVPVTLYGASAGAGSIGIHTVSQGETLYTISKRYRLATQDIVLANNLSLPFQLREGQRLKLPPPREYRVKTGDSLYTLSRLFGVEPSQIVRLNGLPAPYAVQPGQILRLPAPIIKNTTIYKDKQIVMREPSPVMPVEREVLSDAPQTSKAAVPSLPPQPQPEKIQHASIETLKKAPKEKITSSVPKRAGKKFLKPLQGEIISGYGPKNDGLHNDGINIAAPLGTPVKASENGVVVYAGNELKGSGNLVLIRHEGGWMTAYAHLDRVEAKRGSVISRGQVLGTVGSTGSVDSPQLHFEIRRGTEALNPKMYIES